ncbi:hypothetical protein MLD38_017231 [Melastoma candidum]|uniref:Uncharacterized protein n=1 Tax=Melastoma candidum TaxID=119954 RepID=A0ACB9QTG6_9MYRT|nr:hypothetical protein MLD38_017231 [Melastoma candidum]
MGVAVGDASMEDKRELLGLLAQEELAEWELSRILYQAKDVNHQAARTKWGPNGEEKEFEAPDDMYILESAENAGWSSCILAVQGRVPLARGRRCRDRLISRTARSSTRTK